MHTIILTKSCMHTYIIWYAIAQKNIGHIIFLIWKIVVIVKYSNVLVVQLQGWKSNQSFFPINPYWKCRQKHYLHCWVGGREKNEGKVRAYDMLANNSVRDHNAKKRTKIEINCGALFSVLCTVLEYYPQYYIILLHKFTSWKKHTLLLICMLFFICLPIRRPPKNEIISFGYDRSSVEQTALSISANWQHE